MRVLCGTALSILVASVNAHGLIYSPVARNVSTAVEEACGSAVTTLLRRDYTDHIEGLPEAAATDPAYDPEACNLWLCRGLQFEDNTENVHVYEPGQVVPFKAWLRVRHEGPANVSIVDTKTNAIIGTPLVDWKSYANDKIPLGQVPLNNTQFDVIIPEDLDGKCSIPGDCVIQWWWYGTAARQTYESCVDFVVRKSTPMRFTKRS